MPSNVASYGKSFQRVGNSPERAAPLRDAQGAASCISTNELPSAALVRHLLFPISALGALMLSGVLYAQPFTRPYIILSLLTFVLTWKFLAAADQELRPFSKIELVMPRLILGWARVLGILLFLGFAAKVTDSYSRAVIITWAIITPFLYAFAHTLAYRFLCQWHLRGRITRTHIIVGTNDRAKDLANRINSDASLGKFIGFFSQEDASGVLGPLQDLPEYVRRNAIDVIHIAYPLGSDSGVQRLLERLRDTTASIYFLLDVPSPDHQPTRIVEMAGVPLLAYVETPHCGLQGVVKRLADLVIASLMLAVLSPVLVLIAVLIRMDSRGPIVFKQRRYGLNGEEIAVYKFRTMNVCEDGDVIVQASRNDPRITRIGRFLRRTSLDELPQLFCVLTGSMSLVGPRPHAVAQNEQYRRLIDGYMLRHKVRPGITGWAQVNGQRGETRTVEQMRTRVLYDLEYLQHWSPWIDIKILLRTALLVIRDRNAY